jgi:uncharacterized glyoxalase superfamily protein PhnB
VGDEGPGPQGLRAREGFRSLAALLRELGFNEKWHNPQVAEFEIGGFRFLLQNFYNEQLAANFMMHLHVDDCDAWWKRISDAGLKEKYQLHMARPPALQPWGLRVLFISDPTGVLWHIADTPGA